MNPRAMNVKYSADIRQKLTYTSVEVSNDKHGDDAKFSGLSQSEFFTQCDLVLPLSIYSILSFP
jgi:hypothetical protein